MSESPLKFDVEFLNGGGIVVRTKTVTTETVSYTAAEQTTDGLTPGNLVRMKIYQISATVGRGYVRDVTL